MRTLVLQQQQQQWLHLHNAELATAVQHGENARLSDHSVRPTMHNVSSDQLTLSACV